MFGAGAGMAERAQGWLGISQSMWPFHMASLGFLIVWWIQVIEQSLLVAGFAQSELSKRQEGQSAEPGPDN